MWLQLLNFLIFTVKICNREVRRHTDAMQLVWSWHQTIIAIAKVPNNCVKYDQQRTAVQQSSPPVHQVNIDFNNIHTDNF